MTTAHAQDAHAAGPVFYRRATVDLTEFLQLRKEDGSRVAELARPLVIQTPTVTLTTPLHDDDDEITHAYLTLPPAFGEFAADVEDEVLKAALDHKAEWFREGTEDETVVAAFRQLYKPSGHLKVQVSPDAAVFDAEGGLLSRADVAPGQSVRAILRLDRITFGRFEFGAMWTLVQAQVRPAPSPRPPEPRCLISTEDDDANPEPAPSVHEFH